MIGRERRRMKRWREGGEEDCWVESCSMGGRLGRNEKQPDFTAKFVLDFLSEDLGLPRKLCRVFTCFTGLEKHLKYHFLYVQVMDINWTLQSLHIAVSSRDGNSPTRPVSKSSTLSDIPEFAIAIIHCVKSSCAGPSMGESSSDADRSHRSWFFFTNMVIVRLDRASNRSRYGAVVFHRSAMTTKTIVQSVHVLLMSSYRIVSRIVCDAQMQ